MVLEKVLIWSRKRRSRNSSLGFFGLGNGFRASQPPCGVGLGFVRILQAPMSSAVRRMCGGAAPDHHGHLAWVEVELLLRTVPQDALSEVTKFYPPLQLRVFVDDITAFLMGKNEEMAEMAKQVMQRLREEVGKNASNCQSMRMGKKERAR